MRVGSDCAELAIYTQTDGLLMFPYGAAQKNCTSIWKPIIETDGFMPAT